MDRIYVVNSYYLNWSKTIFSSLDHVIHTNLIFTGTFFFLRVSFRSIFDPHLIVCVFEWILLREWVKGQGILLKVEREIKVSKSTGTLESLNGERSSHWRRTIHLMINVLKLKVVTGSSSVWYLSKYEVKKTS